PDPKWRPTAAQALAHPLLAPIEVRRWRSRPGHAPVDVRAASRADSGISAAGSASGSRQSPMLGAASAQVDGLQLACVGSYEPAEQAGGLHTCVHGSSNAVVSECNSKQATPVLGGAPLSAPGSPALGALRDQGVFAGSALGDIRLWESELHQRMSHSAHGERMDSDSSHSYEHAKDSMSSFYSSNDLSSYFY
ncbi:hypothetical protein IWW50_006838, partial [Coemansia erecta]